MGKVKFNICPKTLNLLAPFTFYLPNGVVFVIYLSFLLTEITVKLLGKTLAPTLIVIHQ